MDCEQKKTFNTQTNLNKLVEFLFIVPEDKTSNTIQIQIKTFYFTSKITKIAGCILFGLFSI